MQEKYRRDIPSKFSMFWYKYKPMEFSNMKYLKGNIMTFGLKKGILNTIYLASPLLTRILFYSYKKISLRENIVD